MKKNTINVRELVQKYQANCDRINEIADACETEKRERSEAENVEYEALTRENKLIGMRVQAAAAENLRENPAVGKDMDTQVRELLYSGKTATIRLMREVTPQTTSALDGTGIIPTVQQEMLKPLRAGLIWDKVGINIRTGLVGVLRWPTHSKAVAAWKDEAAELTDSSINFNKLEMTGDRLGIAIPVTKEELDNSVGIVEGVIREEMPLAIADAINAVLFNPSNAKSPFYGAGTSGKAAKVTITPAAPTRKQLLEMKAAVLGSGIRPVAPCWVMSEAMKVILEDTKVDAGSGRFVCENDHILGYPVFTTPTIGNDKIGFGDFSYQAAGFFGGMDLVVDPYTLARRHAVDFVLNTNFGTVTLRPEAFCLGAGA